MARRVLYGLALLAVSPLALAHAHLTSSSPANEAVLKQAPTQLTASFTEGVETALSSLTLTDDSGHTSKLDKLTASADGDNTYQVALPKLKAGHYRIDLHITSVDTHRVEEQLQFTVK
ncbi:copper resistance CopC family protein [Carnimonas bestiolae]|uniref:copper resistance CopC family protein n=1 Tax=Carnimonas bestiolae TaxID=3402172 RepID=UPI003EDC0222